MIRELTVAAAMTAAAIGSASLAMADPFPDPGPMYPDNPGRYPTDVPGMNYEASLGAPCDNFDLFTFGRGPGGQTEACHYINKQNAGYWQISYPLVGVQEIGAPCPGQKSAAQSPDGRPLVCLPDQGWQAGTLTSLPGPLFNPR